MNFQRLQFVAERPMTGAGLECLYAVRLAERPGSLKALCSDILGGRSITEFNYRKSGPDDAFILLGIAAEKPSDHAGFTAKLRDKGYFFADLTVFTIPLSINLRIINGLNNSAAISFGKPHSYNFNSGPTTITERPE